MSRCPARRPGRQPWLALAALAISMAAAAEAEVPPAPAPAASAPDPTDMELEVPRAAGEALAAGQQAALRGRFTEAEEQFRQALDAIELMKGRGDVADAVVARLLGIVLVEQRKYVAAESMLRRALKGYQDDAARRAPAAPALSFRWQRASAASMLGVALFGQKRHAEAEVVLRQALDLLTQLPSRDERTLEQTQLFLGEALTKLDRAADAEPLLRQALQSAERSRPSRDVDIGIALWRLGVALAAQKRLDDAATLLGRALGIYAARPAAEHAGGQDEDIASDLGGVRLAQGQADVAEPLLSKALAFMADRLGGTDIRTQNAARQLADCLRAQGRAAEAGALLARHGIDPETGAAAAGVRPDTARAAADRFAGRYLDALPEPSRQEFLRGVTAYAERRFADSAASFELALLSVERPTEAQLPGKALLESWAGHAKVQQNRYPEGEPHLRRALAAQQSLIARQAPKPNVLDRLLLAETWLRLGLALYGQSKTEPSIDAYRSGLDLADELGRDDQGTAASRMFLAEALFRGRAYVQAEDQFRRALATLDAYHVPEGNDVYLRSAAGMARSLFERRRYTDAVIPLQRAIALYERAPALGPSHRATLWFVWALGVCDYHSARPSEAEAQFRRGLAAAEATLGAMHTDVADFAKWLAMALQTQKRTDEAERQYRRALDIYRGAGATEAAQDVEKKLQELATGSGAAR